MKYMHMYIYIHIHIYIYIYLYIYEVFFSIYIFHFYIIRQQNIFFKILLHTHFYNTLLEEMTIKYS